MTPPILTTRDELLNLCNSLSTQPRIAFDTEFVSEHTYRPQLCLIQVAAGKNVTLIDPIAIGDVRPFWDVIADGSHETIVHAGREEVGFCWSATSKTPNRLFDVQIAAGLVGLEYPAGYGTLLQKLLGREHSKAETRTDWRKRPLSTSQIEYALDDVRDLERIRRALGERLLSLEREEWFWQEMTNWLDELDSWRQRDRWRRVSGSNGLNGRSLAVLRELWLWREEEARRRDVPPRVVLRDDLLVEVARRKADDPKRIAALRGLERSEYRQLIGQMAQVVNRALGLPETDCPRQPRRETSHQLTMMSQFMVAALSSLCREQSLATSLVGTAQDVRDFVQYRLDRDAELENIPALAQGWRKIVAGQMLDDLLFGRLAIRIRDPLAEDPLAFEPLEASDLTPPIDSGE